jgi:glycosyltransferase involved in cell wall biosynthesis
MREGRAGLEPESHAGRSRHPGRARGIAFVSHSGDWTGAPIVLSRLFRWVMTRTHEDAYLIFRHAGPLAAACRREFPSERVFVVAEKSPRVVSRPVKPFRKCRDLVSLVRLLARLKPEVVVVNSLINTLAVVAGRLVRSKVVLWVHEVPGSTNDPLALRSLVNRWAHVGLGVSNQSCDYLRAIAFPPSRVFRMPHGLDLSVWTAGVTSGSPRLPREDGLTLGALAIWSPNKRVDLIVEAAIAVAEAKPEIRVELRLGGSDDADSPGLLDRTRERYADLPANLRVQFIGPVEDAAGFYHGLDALLVASDRESLPTVVLEALASELPTFSFRDLPGVREILGADRCLATERTGSALASTLVEFFYGSPQPATLEAWRKSARERVQQFSLEAQWKAFRTIIDHLA